MAKQSFTLERNKARGETEVHHANGFLLGRHELPIYKGQSTRAYFLDSETYEVTEIGKFSMPYTAANKMIEVWESKAGEREVRRLEKYNKWFNSPIVSKMHKDFLSLNKSSSDFMRFFRSNLDQYEKDYPELIG